MIIDKISHRVHREHRVLFFSDMDLYGFELEKIAREKNWLVMIKPRQAHMICSASEGYLSVGRDTRSVRRFRVTKPGSTDFSASRLRIIKPALIMSASARATWVTTSRSRRIRARGPVLEDLVDSVMMLE